VDFSSSDEEGAANGSRGGDGQRRASGSGELSTPASSSDQDGAAAGGQRAPSADGAGLQSPRRDRRRDKFKVLMGIASDESAKTLRGLRRHASDVQAGTVGRSELSASALRMGQIEYIGILRIRLVEGRDLKKKDRLTGKADPYVIFRLGGKEVRSGVQKRTLNPIWNEEFQLSVPSLDSTLEVLVFDADLVGEDQAMGDAKIPLKARARRGRGEGRDGARGRGASSADVPRVLPARCAADVQGHQGVGPAAAGGH
jgi:hypothetical protein